MTVELDRPPAEFEPEVYEQYRAVSTLAVASLVLGVMAVLTFAGWTLGAIGIVGAILGCTALVKIRKNPTELTGRGLAVAGVALSVLFVAAGWSWRTYDYLTEVPEGCMRISYAELTPADNEPQNRPPASAMALDGKKVFIKGYMYPGARTRGIEQFVLCRDNGDCCFGGQPKLTDMIQVKLKGVPPTDYTTRMRRVAGTLRIDPQRAVDDRGVVLYQLEAEHLK